MADNSLKSSDRLKKVLKKFSQTFKNKKSWDDNEEIFVYDLVEEQKEDKTTYNGKIFIGNVNEHQVIKDNVKSCLVNGLLLDKKLNNDKENLKNMSLKYIANNFFSKTPHFLGHKFKIEGPKPHKQLLIEFDENQDIDNFKGQCIEAHKSFFKVLSGTLFKQQGSESIQVDNGIEIFDSNINKYLGDMTKITVKHFTNTKVDKSIRISEARDNIVITTDPYIITITYFGFKCEEAKSNGGDRIIIDNNTQINKINDIINNVVKDKHIVEMLKCLNNFFYSTEVDIIKKLFKNHFGVEFVMEDENNTNKHKTQNTIENKDKKEQNKDNFVMSGIIIGTDNKNKEQEKEKASKEGKKVFFVDTGIIVGGNIKKKTDKKDKNKEQDVLSYKNDNAGNINLQLRSKYDNNPLSSRNITEIKKKEEITERQIKDKVEEAYTELLQNKKTLEQNKWKQYDKDKTIYYKFENGKIKVMYNKKDDIDLKDQKLADKILLKCYGKQELDNNQICEGYLDENGNLQGKGKIISKSGDTYEGDWTNNRRDGFGIYTYNKHNSNIGFCHYKNGKKQGIEVVYVKVHNHFLIFDLDNKLLVGEPIKTKRDLNKKLKSLQQKNKCDDEYVRFVNNKIESLKQEKIIKTEEATVYNNKIDSNNIDEFLNNNKKVNNYIRRNAKKLYAKLEAVSKKDFKKDAKRQFNHFNNIFYPKNF